MELDPAYWPQFAPRCARIGNYRTGLAELTAREFLNCLMTLGLVGRTPAGRPDIGPDLSTIGDDGEFAAAFHAEWERLLDFENGAYGFQVEPTRVGVNRLLHWGPLKATSCPHTRRGEPVFDDQQNWGMSLCQRRLELPHSAKLDRVASAW